VRLYLDAAPVIYLVEGTLPFAITVEAYLARPGVEIVASELTRLECRVKPVRNAQIRLLRQFDAFFSATAQDIVPLSRDVMDRATEIRAQHGFSTPDAIHVAAALVAGCDVFLTNDYRLQRPIGIQVDVI
jgi:uncharacterized protein